MDSGDSPLTRASDRTAPSSFRFDVANQHWSIQSGERHIFASPAYWIDQTSRGDYPVRCETIASTTDLLNEVVFCLLGGFGVTAEAATVAHQAVMPLVQAGSPTQASIERILREPMVFPDKSSRRYRFPIQRSQRISQAVTQIRHHTPPQDPVALRTWLLTVPGIGPKTVSWIVRNLTGSNDVAIVDIWLIRALTLTRVFQPKWRADRNYEYFEDAFLQFARQAAVPASALDLCIWDQSRRAARVPSLARLLRMQGQPDSNPTLEPLAGPLTDPAGGSLGDPSPTALTRIHHKTGSPEKEIPQILRQNGVPAPSSSCDHNSRRAATIRNL